nr:zinc knuckle CX2CX4HX4C [Tanacetum cinerariifolium]
MVTSGVSSGSSATHIQTDEKLVTSSHDEQQHYATCDNATNDQGLHGATDGIMKDNVNGTKQSFAAIFKAPTADKVVRLTEMKNNEAVQGANVAIPLRAVEEIRNMFQNTLYGYFIGKRLAFPLVENYVKNAWAKFGLERSMLVNGFFFFQFATKEVVETKASADVDENDGFTQVTRKRGKGKQEGKGKQVAGIRLSKPKPNMVYQVVHKPPNNNDGTSSSTKNDDVPPPKPPAIPSNKEDEDEEVKEVFNKEESWKSKDNMGANIPFNKVTNV